MVEQRDEMTRENKVEADAADNRTVGEAVSYAFFKRLFDVVDGSFRSKTYRSIANRWSEGF